MIIFLIFFFRPCFLVIFVFQVIRVFLLYFSGSLSKLFFNFQLFFKKVFPKGTSGFIFIWTKKFTDMFFCPFVRPFVSPCSQLVQQKRVFFGFLWFVFNGISIVNWTVFVFFWVYWAQTPTSPTFFGPWLVILHISHNFRTTCLISYDWHFLWIFDFIHISPLLSVPRTPRFRMLDTSMTWNLLWSDTPTNTR